MWNSRRVNLQVRVRGLVNGGGRAVWIRGQHGYLATYGSRLRSKQQGARNPRPTQLTGSRWPRLAHKAGGGVESCGRACWRSASGESVEGALASLYSQPAWERETGPLNVIGPKPKRSWVLDGRSRSRIWSCLLEMPKGSPPSPAHPPPPAACVAVGWYEKAYFQAMASGTAEVRILRSRWAWDFDRRRSPSSVPVEHSMEHSIQRSMEHSMGDSMGCSTEHCWSVLWVHPMEALDGGIQRSINFMENSKEHSMEDSNEHLMEHCLEQTFDGTSDGKSDGTFDGTFDGTSDAHSTEYSTEHSMEHSMEHSTEPTIGETFDRYVPDRHMTLTSSTPVMTSRLRHSSMSIGTIGMRTGIHRARAHAPLESSIVGDGRKRHARHAVGDADAHLTGM